MCECAAIPFSSVVLFTRDGRNGEGWSWRVSSGRGEGRDRELRTLLLKDYLLKRDFITQERFYYTRELVS